MLESGDMAEARRNAHREKTKRTRKDVDGFKAAQQQYATAVQEKFSSELEEVGKSLFSTPQDIADIARKKESPISEKLKAVVVVKRKQPEGPEKKDKKEKKKKKKDKKKKKEKKEDSAGVGLGLVGYGSDDSD